MGTFLILLGEFALSKDVQRKSTLEGHFNENRLLVSILAVELGVYRLQLLFIIVLKM